MINKSNESYDGESTLVMMQSGPASEEANDEYGYAQGDETVPHDVYGLVRRNVGGEQVQQVSLVRVHHEPHSNHRQRASGQLKTGK